MPKRSTLPPNWETLLAQAALMQAKVPGAVLVGGTAAALHAHHRPSLYHDHVIKDLAKHYDQAIAALETIVGWRTKRRVKGRLALGEIHGIDAGLRNQMRSAPLETTTVHLPGDRTLKLPTVEEMLRIKAFLLVQRNAVRDYLDVAALSHHLGLHTSARALDTMNQLYAQFAGEGGDMLGSVIIKLANPDPYDLTEVDLTEYKGIAAPWSDWRAVKTQCRKVAVALLDEEEPAGGPTSK